MSFWESILWVTGVTLAVFSVVEFRKKPDVVYVFQKVFSRKYLIPLATIVVAFIVLRVVLISLGPVFSFIFSP